MSITNCPMTADFAPFAKGNISPPSNIGSILNFFKEAVSRYERNAGGKSRCGGGIHNRK